MASEEVTVTPGPRAAEVVEIWTDGGCRPNPGPGGWGAILRFRGVERELSGAEPATTNNRMELTAAMMALEALKRPCRVVLHTDSEYLKNGITRWHAGWVRRTASAIAETGASSSNRNAARANSEDSSPFMPTQTLSAVNCAGMTTRIVLAAELWPPFAPEVPERGTNVMVFCLRAQPTHSARPSRMASRPCFKVSPTSSPPSLGLHAVQGA